MIVTSIKIREMLTLTGLAAALHFMVDCLCLCCLYLVTAGFDELIRYFIAYNVLAFLTQPLTGMMADGIRQRHWLLLASVILLVLATLLSSVSWSVYPSAFLLMAISVLLGLGNSLFHVWGGKETAVNTGNDIRALGVFVSTGAFGLAVGTVLVSWALLYGLLIGISIVALLYLRIDVKTLHTEADADMAGAKEYSKLLAWGIVILVMLIVAARSYIGQSFSAGQTKTALMVIVFGAVTMLGKMAGGWIVKWMGMTTAIILMLAGIAVCFAFRNVSLGFVLAGLFAVNLTMSVTLYWANRMMKGREGLAFGLLAAALIPGYLIATL